MKVYFRGQLRYEGCYYYRCLLPLQINGWSGDLLTMRSQLNPEESRKAILDAEVVVMQRPFEKASKDLFIALKQAGKKIVFDNDDTYKVNDVMKLGSMLDDMNASVDWFIKNSDMVTTTNEFLAEEYRKLNPNVHVLPNFINPEDFPTKILKNRTKKVRIGIIGSVSLYNTEDIEHIKPLLKELSERDDVTLVVFGQSPEGGFWKDLNIEYHPFVHIYDYYKKLNELKLDLAIIPRADTYFNRCKSNVKFLECSMLEIPVIAQTWNDGQSPYDKDIDAGVLEPANTLEEWREKVNLLIGEKTLRKIIGKRAKKYVLKHYNVDKAKLWKHTLQSMQ